MRPISRRAFKTGGKVEGEDNERRADRAPRGFKEKVGLANTNQKDANEEREGKKHVGGFKKGGRIGGAQALLGTMLSIKPCVDISTGVVEEAGKQRTRKKALQWLASTVADRQVEDLAVMDAAADDIEDFLAMLPAPHSREDIRLGTIGAVIGTHGGPGVVGVCWIDPA